MSTMTFIGRTTREAMALAKARFGPEVEIVDSRQTPDGVELTAIVHGVPLQRRHLQPQIAPDAQRRRVVGAAALPSDEAEALEEPRPMSTVSFESYVRDRQERQPAPAQAHGQTPAPASAARQPRGAHFPQQRQLPSGASSAAAGLSARLAMPAQGQPAVSGALASHGIQAGRNAQGVSAAPGSQGPVDAVERDRRNADDQAALLGELRSIKQFVASQLETVRWFDTARRRPSQMRLLRLLLARQFSTVLAKSLCDLLPMDFSDSQADHWLRQTLIRTVSSFAPVDHGLLPSGAGGEGFAGTAAMGMPSLFDRGGVFALTGPTGVGKTTTVAKIAAQYAMRHGASQVALITADVYRIGAQEQLRSFGQMLGAPVHVAHDRAALQDLLGLFGDRKLVLIDTAGVSQRDSRVEQLLSALDLDPIQRVVVLNAGMQAAGLQEVAAAYRAQDCAGVLLSKTDEAVQLGSALDCLVRNRLRLLGFSDGQRVPEDFHGPDLDFLVECAMSPPEGQGIDDGELDTAEVRFILEGAHV